MAMVLRLLFLLVMGLGLCMAGPSLAQASCPVMEAGTTTLPAISNLRAKRVSRGVLVRWASPSSLGTSTHVEIRVQALPSGPCQSVLIDHDDYANRIVMDDQPGTDLVITASLVDGQSQMSSPATITLTQWQRKAGYPDRQDDRSQGDSLDFRMSAPRGTPEPEATDTPTGTETPTPEPTETPTPNPYEHTC